MPISFACPECGVKLNVPETMAGKKGRCPKCGAAATVPADTNGAAAGAAVVKKAKVLSDAPAPAEDDDLITEAVEEEEPAPAPARAKKVEDRPSKKRRDDEDEDDDRPRKRRSRDDEEDEEDDRPRKKRARDDDDDEEDDDDDDRPRKKRARDDADDDDDDDRPRKKRARDDDDDEDEDDDDEGLSDKERERKKFRKKLGKKKKRGKSRLMLWLSLAGGFVVLAGGGLLVWFLFFGGGVDERWLPDDVTNVHCENYDAGRSAGIYKKIMAELGEDGKKLVDARMSGYLEIKSDDISRMVSASSQKNGSVTVLYLASSKSADDIASGSKQEYDKKTVGSYTLYANKRGASSQSFAVPQSSVVLIGTEETLKKILERNGKAQMTENMRTALGNISTRKVESFAGVSGRDDADSFVYSYGHTDAGSSSITTKRVMVFQSKEAAEKAKTKTEERLANTSAPKKPTITVSGSTMTSTDTTTFEEIKEMIQKFKKP